MWPEKSNPTGNRNQLTGLEDGMSSSIRSTRLQYGLQYATTADIRKTVLVSVLELLYMSEMLVHPMR